MIIDGNDDPNVQNGVGSGITLWPKNSLGEVIVPFIINTDGCKYIS